VGLTTPHGKKIILKRVEQRKKPHRFNDDGRIRTGNTKIRKVTWKVQTAKTWKNERNNGIDRQRMSGRSCYAGNSLARTRKN
jgi:hypothetical protein